MNKAESIAEATLEWFFNDSDHDIGIRSNYMAMVNVAIYGGATNYDPHDSYIAVLDAAHRKSKISNVLNKLTDQQKGTLFYTYGPQKFTAPIQKVFNKYTGATVYNTFLNLKQLSSLVHKIHLGKASPQEKLLLQKIQTQAQSNYYDAINAYYQQWRNAPK